MLKFIRTKPRMWRGNGFGYSSAEYDIAQNGQVIGHLNDAGIAYGWRARMNDGLTMNSPDGRLASLKHELVKREEIEAELKYRNHIPHEGPCDASCRGHFDN